jgi:hypothetical protein
MCLRLLVIYIYIYVYAHLSAYLEVALQFVHVAAHGLGICSHASSPATPPGVDQRGVQHKCIRRAADLSSSACTSIGTIRCDRSGAEMTTSLEYSPGSGADAVLEASKGRRAGGCKHMDIYEYIEAIYVLYYGHRRSACMRTWMSRLSCSTPQLTPRRGEAPLPPAPLNPPPPLPAGAP